MKYINCKVNTLKGDIVFIKPTRDIVLNELENLSTTITFNFDVPIPKTDNLFIIFNNSGFVVTHRLVKVDENQYNIEIPREVMRKGRLYFAIQRYDMTLEQLTKYTPESYLYINKSLDISLDTMDGSPDIFAELFYRVKQLEKIVYHNQKGQD